MMRTIFTVLVMTSTLAAAEPDDTLRWRARAALALTFSTPATPTYEQQYARALAVQKPLLVFVGQPVQEVNDCLGVRCETFPNVVAPAVVIGHAGAKSLTRSDVMGIPTLDELRAAVLRVPAVATPLPGSRP